MQSREVTTVVLSCEDTLVDSLGAIESVAYELARHNGESPLDRGSALAGRVVSLAAAGLPAAFEQLARERAWRYEESGEESLSRVAFLARPYADALDAVALAALSGRRLVVLSHGDPQLTHVALRPFGDAFDAVVAPDRLRCGEESLVVSTSRPVLQHASAHGAQTVWLNRGGRGRPIVPEDEWQSLAALPRCLGMGVA
ncbi:MAG: hypothetical protein L0K86_17290 [Actinomycetia bacterium]|nr:hypothetical protein [Actinomycetes bacterium]